MSLSAAPPITAVCPQLEAAWGGPLTRALSPQHGAAQGGPQNSSECVLCCAVLCLGATSWMRSINSLFSKQALHSSPHEAKTLLSSNTRILDKASLLQSRTGCSVSEEQEWPFKPLSLQIFQTLCCSVRTLRREHGLPYLSSQIWPSLRWSLWQILWTGTCALRGRLTSPVTLAAASLEAPR